jgi:HNH endonuclease
MTTGDLGEQPLALILAGNRGAETKFLPYLSTFLACPVCGFEFNHVRDIRVVKAHEAYGAGWFGRGDLFVISGYCEEGHDWEVCLGEHKGTVYVFARSPQPLARLREMPYREYLKTSHWQILRNKKLRLAENRCEDCGSAKDLQVHHLTYERRGEEDLDDLKVLCAVCHEKVHAGRTP